MAGQGLLPTGWCWRKGRPGSLTTAAALLYFHAVQA